jgi:hypothetical protein
MPKDSDSTRSIVFDLATLRDDHRSTTRRYVLKTIFKRSSWTWFIGLIAITLLSVVALLTFLFIYAGPGTSSTWVGVGIGTVLAILTIAIELSASAAFKDKLPDEKQGIIPFDLRLRTLRYLLFKERADKQGPYSPEHLEALSEIDREERSLDRFAIERHPVYIVLLFGVLTLISSATGHFPIWTNGIGKTLAIYLGAIFVMWWLFRKAFAALFLTPGYREREFGLFLKMLASDTMRCELARFHAPSIAATENNPSLTNEDGSNTSSRCTNNLPRR